MTPFFIGLTGIWTKFGQLNDFLNSELHIILKLRNLEIGEHLIFSIIENKYF